ncbi:hypothetical protein PHMEG_00024507 [Phytophthora megakarya]|uniref:BZIP domain-containing protein n=1 Tax=Phytophthora megakarya TaxID=4795 RepID=A0A225VEH9_9STRA|nr:hypothetical protein PHMEG_00024507 [Phytophthora megakarya]
MSQSTIDANARAAVELERRKERNRMHQARYKKKQNMHMLGMEDTIQLLKDEIRKLQLTRQFKSLEPANKTSWSVLTEYFRLFRFGVKPSGHVAAENMYPIDPQAQHNFLLKTMAPDVTNGIMGGVDGVMKIWEHESLCFPGLWVDIKCLEDGPDGSIIVTTKHNLTISEATLHYMFPHLIHGDGEYSQLVNKLLGQQLLTHVVVHFEWDSETGRVNSYVSKADIVTPMLRLLGNLEDVSHVFKGSRMTPTGEAIASL